MSIGSVLNSLMLVELGKGLMLIVVVLVIVGILVIFGLVPFRGWG